LLFGLTEKFHWFHGTPQEYLVGQAVTHGCMRMLNKDILALYAQVGSVHL
jgi:lipoprotein-anchoring transpeptidase ErfK/SrfK